MSETVIGVLLVLLVAVVGGAFSLRAVWRDLAKQPSMRALNALRRTRPKPIGAVKEGEVVRLVGKAIATGPLARAPLSARPCLAHHVRVEHIYESRSSDGTSSTSRELVIDACGGVDFLLECEGDRALVQVAGALACLEMTERCGEATYESAHDTPALAALLRANLLELSGRYDAEEGVVREGELVAVCGKAGWRESSGDVRGGYRGRPRQLVIAGAPETPVCIGNVLRALE
jgi:hypothetical protein